MIAKLPDDIIACEDTKTKSNSRDNLKFGTWSPSLRPLPTNSEKCMVTDQLLANGSPFPGMEEHTTTTQEGEAVGTHALSEHNVANEAEPTTDAAARVAMLNTDTNMQENTCARRWVVPIVSTGGQMPTTQEDEAIGSCARFEHNAVIEVEPAIDTAAHVAVLSTDTTMQESACARRWGVPVANTGEHNMPSTLQGEAEGVCTEHDIAINVVPTLDGDANSATLGTDNKTQERAGARRWGVPIACTVESAITTQGDDSVGLCERPQAPIGHARPSKTLAAVATYAADMSASGSTNNGASLELAKHSETMPHQPLAQIPTFSKTAHGNPIHWNHLKRVFYWSAKNSKRCPDYFAPRRSVDDIMEFLRVRHGPDGQPVANRLGPPEEKGSGWYRCRWQGPRDRSDEELEKAGWSKGWHGCKMESLYSILYHGHFVESCNRERGDRFFEGSPGVYLHKHWQKALFYTRFCPLFQNGTFCSAVFEVLADRSDKVHVDQKTDQWVNRARSTRIVAVWLCSRTKLDMENGDEVAESWDPELEANPFDEEWKNVTNIGKVTLGDFMALQIDDISQQATTQAVTHTDTHVVTRAATREKHLEIWSTKFARPFIVRRLNDTWEEDFCLLCQKWADECHLSSKRHRKRVENPEDYAADNEHIAALLRDPSDALTVASAGTSEIQALNDETAPRVLDTVNACASACALNNGQESETQGGQACKDVDGLADEISPRALDTINACASAFAVENGKDPKFGQEFTVAKLRKCGLRSISSLASASEEQWPVDKKGKNVLPERLVKMIRDHAIQLVSASSF